MQSSVALCLLVVLGSALAVPQSSLSAFYKAASQQITVEQARSMLKFSSKIIGCYPPAVGELVKSVTDEQIAQAVALHNGLIDGSITFPNNRDEGLALVKEHIPSIYDRLVAINNDYQQRLEKLSPDLMNGLISLEKQAFVTADNRTQAAYVEYMLNFCSKYEQLTPAFHDSLKEAFPETIACLDNPIQGKICKLVQALKEERYQINTKVLQKFADIMSDPFFSGHKDN